MYLLKTEKYREKITHVAATQTHPEDEGIFDL
jgi:hypothetical protein